MYRCLWVTFAIATAFFTGCIGEPGVQHAPPTGAHFDEEIVLEWKAKIRGELGKGPFARYSDEEVFYRVRGQEKYRPARVERIHADKELMIVKATIPPIAAEEGDKLEYYMTAKFDGRSFQMGKFDEQDRYRYINADNPNAIVLTRRRSKE